MYEEPFCALDRFISIRDTEEGSRKHGERNRDSCDGRMNNARQKQQHICSTNCEIWKTSKQTREREKKPSRQNEKSRHITPLFIHQFHLQFLAISSIRCISYTCYPFLFHILPWHRWCAELFCLWYTRRFCSMLERRTKELREPGCSDAVDYTGSRFSSPVNWETAKSERANVKWLLFNSSFKYTHRLFCFWHLILLPSRSLPFLSSFSVPLNRYHNVHTCMSVYLLVCIRKASLGGWVIYHPFHIQYAMSMISICSSP